MPERYGFRMSPRQWWPAIRPVAVAFGLLALMGGLILGLTEAHNRRLHEASLADRAAITAQVDRNTRKMDELTEATRRADAAHAAIAGQLERIEGKVDRLAK